MFVTMLSSFELNVMIMTISFHKREKLVIEIMNWDNNGDNLYFHMAARQRRGQNEQVPPPTPPAPMVQELMA
jgi:hypothetical protein